MYLILPVNGMQRVIFSFSSGASPAHNAGGRVLPICIDIQVSQKNLRNITPGGSVLVSLRYAHPARSYAVINIM